MVTPPTDTTGASNSPPHDDPFGLTEGVSVLEARELRERTALLGHAFAYVASAAEPPPRLRERLLQRVRSTPQVQHAHEIVPGIMFVFRNEGEWTDTGLPGVQLKYLLVDEARRYVRTLVRMAPGAVYPPHLHQAREETLLLEGDLQIDGQHMHPGDYCVAAAYTAHGALTTEGGALFMALACIDDRPISHGELRRIRAEQASRG